MNILSIKDFDNCMYAETPEFFKELVDVWLSHLIEMGGYNCYKEAETDLWHFFKGGKYCFVPSIQNVAEYHKAVHDEFIRRGMFERLIKPCSTSVGLGQKYASKHKVVVMTHSDTNYALHALDFLGFLGKVVKEEDVWGFDRFGVCLTNMKTNKKPFLGLLEYYGYEAENAKITEDSEANLIAPYSMGLICNHITHGNEPKVSMPFKRYESYSEYLELNI